MMIYKKNNKTEKALAMFQELYQAAKQANEPHALTLLLKQKYELQILSSNKRVT